MRMHPIMNAARMLELTIMSQHTIMVNGAQQKLPPSPTAHMPAWCIHNYHNSSAAARLSVCLCATDARRVCSSEGIGVFFAAGCKSWGIRCNETHHWRKFQ